MDKLGTLRIKKVVDKAGFPLLAGACFTISPDPRNGATGSAIVCDNNFDGVPGTALPDLTDTDNDAGEVCVEDVRLKTGTYSITESTVPPNFLGDTPKTQSVTNSNTCAQRDTAGGTAVAIFKNTPLSTFQIIFNDLTGYTDAAIDCTNATEVSENGGADSLTITNTAANPTVVTTSAAHGLTDGAKVQITGSNSTPSINGTFVVDVLTATTFSIPVNVSAAGTLGTVMSFDDANETFGDGTTGLVPNVYNCTINVDP